MTRRPGIPLRTGRGSEIKSLEELGRAVVLMGIAHTDTDVQNAESKAASDESDRTFARMRRERAGLGGLSSVLLIVVIAQQIYFRGYDAGRATQEATEPQAEVQPEPIVPGPPPVTDKAPAPDVEAQRLRALAVALGTLAAEQQDYMVTVLAAQAARKKMPPKPDSLLRAEAELRRLQSAP